MEAYLSKIGGGFKTCCTYYLDFDEPHQITVGPGVCSQDVQGSGTAGDGPGTGFVASQILFNNFITFSNLMFS